jgi:peptide/nickel transport system substrate-binding protein
MKKRILSIGALATVGVLALSACSGGGAPSPTSAGFAISAPFTTAIDQDPGNLNPLLTNIQAAVAVDAYAYDSLLYFEPSSGTPKPYLANSWTDGTDSVSFTLKKGITCADGTAFTAQTAADNFNWIVDPANASPLRGSVIDATAVATAKGNVLTVTTPKPSPFLLYNVGNSQLACEKVLKDPTSASTMSDGTGLFNITQNVANDHITLERRDGYNWGPNGGTTSKTVGVPKSVTIKIVTDPSTTANLLISGQVNAATVTGADEARVSKLRSRSYSQMSGEIIFNHNHGVATADAAVRVALTQAVNLDTFTKINTADKGKRATSLLALNPKTCTYDSVKNAIPTFDTRAAAKTLADAGWTKGAGGKLTKNGKALSLNVFYINTVDSQSAAAEYLAQQWEALGASVKLQGGDENYLASSTFTATDPASWSVAVDLLLQSNLPSIFRSYLSGPTPPDGANFAFINNPGYTRLSTEAASLSGQDACEKWKGAESALFKSSDLLPVSVTPVNMYFNGAESLLDPVGGVLPGAAIRMLK